MRTINKTIKIYTFEELSEDAQETAIMHEREVTLDYSWWQWIIEDLQGQCEEKGIKFSTDDIQFNLGRGAYLYVYSNKLILKWQAEIDLPTKFGAYQNYHGGGINCSIQSEFIEDFRVSNLGRGEKKNCVARKLNACLVLFEETLASLWREYHEIQEDKYLIDIIKGNDLEYTEEGEIYNG